MKLNFIHPVLVLSLLTAGLSILAAPEAAAKLSPTQVKRCLSGRIPVRITEDVFVFDPTGTNFLGTIPLAGNGRLKIGRGASNVAGNQFKISRIRVRGSNKIIVTGGTQDVINTIFRLRGSLKIVIVKRGGKARITTGKYTWGGTEFTTGNIWTVTNGRITGSRGLSKKCKH